MSRAASGSAAAWSRRDLLASLGGLCLAPSAFSQSSSPRPVFSSESKRVQLAAVALDRRGRPVPDLRAADFEVLENGRAQKLLHFSAGRDAAAALLILQDVSGSMGRQRSSVSAWMATRQLIGSLEANDEVALATFAAEYELRVPFTRERQRVLREAAGSPGFGATALHDALLRAAEEAATRGEVRRAVVALTDGVDTASRLSPEVVLERSRALDVPLYAISVLSPVDDPSADEYLGASHSTATSQGLEALRRYAELSGGVAFAVSRFAGLQAAAARIARELEHQYRLGYEPPEGPRGLRQLQVRCRRPGVSVRTRTGYRPAT